MTYEIYSSGPVETNSILFYIDASPIAILFDAPLDSVAHWKKRLAQLKKSLGALLLTHSHWDHTADVAEAKRIWGMPIGIHQDDLGNLEKPGSDGLPMMVSIEPAKADFFVKDGEEKIIGGVLIRTLHSPGHTPGGVCYYLPEHALLISGDTLFKGTIGNLGFPTARPKLMKDSLKKILSLPFETLVIPGHGETTTIGEEQDILRRFYG
jgi:hydroxyacylglutathione hydrolase